MKEQFRQLVALYIRAKDRHQPHLMKLAFAEDATLEMVVDTDAITFPPETIGLENITDILVKEFHTRFDNVYTFCISDSEIESVNELRCMWFVGMTDIDSGALRIGYGEYHWKFSEKNANESLRVRQLTILINKMVVLPKETALSVLPWLDSLPHPWCSHSDVSLLAPDISTIHEFLTTGWCVKS